MTASEQAKATAKTNAERQEALKQRRLAKGIVRRGYWATPVEHKLLKAKLAELRK